MDTAKEAASSASSPKTKRRVILLAGYVLLTALIFVEYLDVPARVFRPWCVDSLVFALLAWLSGVGQAVVRFSAWAALVVVRALAWALLALLLVRQVTLTLGALYVRGVISGPHGEHYRPDPAGRGP
jgi:hypothetical protein